MKRLVLCVFVYSVPLLLACRPVGRDNLEAMPAESNTEGNVVSGRVWHESDITPLPDQPFKKGFLLVFELSIWKESAEVEGWSSEERRGFSVDETVLSKVSTITKIKADGTFELMLPAVEQVICLAAPHPLEVETPGFVYGCISFKVEGERHLDLFYGEGGVLAKD